MILILLLTILFAAAWIIAKLALAYSAPFFLVGSRMTVAGLLLLGYYVMRHGFIWYRPTKKDIISFAYTILFGFYFMYLFDFWSLQYLSTTRASFLFNAAPFFTAFFSYIYFNEKMTLKKIIGMTIAFLGFLPSLLYGTSSSEPTLSLPAVVMIMATASYAYGWVVMRRLIKIRHYPILVINGVGMLVAGMLLLLTSLITEGWLPVSDPLPFGIALFFIILVSNFALYYLYGFLLKGYTATFLSMVVLTAPLITALFDWLYFGKTVGSLFVISFVMVFIGLYLVYQEELKQGYIQKV
jgi:drug/metabolite transporter (DMT)-like permease